MKRYSVVKELSFAVGFKQQQQHNYPIFSHTLNREGENYLVENTPVNVDDMKGHQKSWGMRLS